MYRVGTSIEPHASSPDSPGRGIQTDCQASGAELGGAVVPPSDPEGRSAGASDDPDDTGPLGAAGALGAEVASEPDEDSAAADSGADGAGAAVEPCAASDAAEDVDALEDDAVEPSAPASAVTAAPSPSGRRRPPS